MDVEADRLRDAGCRPYVVPRGAASGLGATAYALAAEELAAQLTITPAHVVAAVGSGGHGRRAARRLGRRSTFRARSSAWR